MMSKLATAVSLASLGFASAQLPPLTLTDGSAPSSVEAPWHCDPAGPPSVALSADSSGITMTMTYYREALTDDNGSPSDRAVHTSGFFKLKSNENRLDYEGDDWLTSNGALSTAMYTSSQDFLGLCDGAPAIAFTRDNIFAQVNERSSFNQFFCEAKNSYAHYTDGVCVCVCVVCLPGVWGWNPHRVASRAEERRALRLLKTPLSTPMRTATRFLRRPTAAR